MSGVFYMRWKPGEPREGRVFNPLADEHPAAALPCLVCNQPLGDGRQVQLFAVGPYDDETREKHAEGRWYTAEAALFHTGCAEAVAAAFVDWLTAEPRLELKPVTELTPEQFEEFKARFEASAHRPPTVIERPVQSVTREQVRGD